MCPPLVTGSTGIESRALSGEAEKFLLYVPLHVGVLTSHGPALHHTPGPKPATSKGAGIIVVDFYATLSAHHNTGATPTLRVSDSLQHGGHTHTHTTLESV